MDFPVNHQVVESACFLKFSQSSLARAFYSKQSHQNRGFPLEIDWWGGGFLAIDYCSRTIGYCFPYYFLEIFVEGQGLDGGEESRNRGISSTRENPENPYKIQILTKYLTWYGIVIVLRLLFRNVLT